jgi:hypothetical protein
MLIHLGKMNTIIRLNYQSKANESLTQLEENNILESSSLKSYNTSRIFTRFINLKIFLNQEMQQKVFYYY